MKYTWLIVFYAHVYMHAYMFIRCYFKIISANLRVQGLNTYITYTKIPMLIGLGASLFTVFTTHHWASLLPGWRSTKGQGDGLVALLLFQGIDHLRTQQGFTSAKRRDGTVAMWWQENQPEDIDDGCLRFFVACVDLDHCSKLHKRPNISV